MDRRVIPLIKARLKADLTQKQVCDRIGITRTHLSKLEGGYCRTKPRLKTIFAMADLFDVDYVVVEKWFIE